MQFNLLQEQRFRPFFLVQLLGAFNDNVFKTALITLLVFGGLGTSKIDYAFMASALPALFILPFLLFSATAGQLADKFEKSMLMRRIKLFEIAIMLFAALGFYLSDLILLTTALFFMGVHSSLFGPVKYAYLPQHLSHEELIGGNALVESATFLAILLGQILGVAIALQAQPARTRARGTRTTSGRTPWAPAAARWTASARVAGRAATRAGARTRPPRRRCSPSCSRRSRPRPRHRVRKLGSARG
jgi:MFS family permease